MIGYAQPPAGEHIRFERHGEPDRWLRRRFAPCDPHLFESGTAALAAALRMVRGNSTTPGYKVVIPAYGCPALVAAVRAAHAEPVLVDLEPQRPWLDLEALQRVLETETVFAVIAVDLFGIKERYGAIRSVAHARGAWVIQDAAQALPVDFRRESTGDLVVLSFGRGKPATLLSGGAVLIRNREAVRWIPRFSTAPHSPVWRIKGWLHNRLLSPRLFWLPKAVPGLGIGKTCYRPLTTVRHMAPPLVAYLPANIAARDRANGRAAEAVAAAVRASGAPLIDLGSLAADASKLTRYPLLAPGGAERDWLLSRLDSAGMGATAMYGHSLAELPDVMGLNQPADSLPAARQFAARLITLPIHGRLKERDFDRMARELSALRSETETHQENLNENSARGRRTTELHEDRPHHRRSGAGRP